MFRAVAACRAGLTAVKVTLTGRDTGPTRTASTNEAGHYSFPLVAPGRYRVSAEKEGFKRAVQELVVETGKRVFIHRRGAERNQFLLCVSASLR
jgi:hypothetical protein